MQIYSGKLQKRINIYMYYFYQFVYNIEKMESDMQKSG